MHTRQIIRGEMTKQQRRKHRQEILNEIGKDWIPKEMAMLVSFGTRKFGMPKKVKRKLVLLLNYIGG